MEAAPLVVRLLHLTEEKNYKPGLLLKQPISKRKKRLAETDKSIMVVLPQ
jgi:hypothetical protein